MSTRSKTYDIRGVWERKDTSGSEIVDYKRSLPVAIATEFGVPEENVRLTADRAKDKPASRYHSTTRTGTFSIKGITVGEAGGPWYLREKRELNRIKTRFTWLLQDACCVPPKVTLTKTKLVRREWS